MKYIIFLFLLLAIGCSSTQSTVYKSDSGSAWKVNVTKKAAIGDEFECFINDSLVISAGFPFIGDNFEKSGQYRGKKVMMNGYKKTTTTTESNGTIKSTDTFQIRVFIDDKLIDKFDF